MGPFLKKIHKVGNLPKKLPKTKLGLKNFVFSKRFSMKSVGFSLSEIFLLLLYYRLDSDEGSMYNGHIVITFVVWSNETARHLNHALLPEYKLHLLTKPSMPILTSTLAQSNRKMSERTTKCEWFTVSTTRTCFSFLFNPSSVMSHSNMGYSINAPRFVASLLVTF